MIKILLADDHPVIGEGIKTMLEKEVEFQVTVVSSGGAALNLLREEVFNILLSDLDMPAMNGLELTKRVVTEHEGIPVLIYSGHEVTSLFNLLVEAGASGFVSKSSTKEQLMIAIHSVLRGETIIPISLFKQLRRLEAQAGHMESASSSLEGTSINEKEQLILYEVAKGKSNREIAETLLMSQRTVEYNLTRIFGKLNVKSRTEAIIEARRYEILPSEGFLSV